MQKQPWKDAKRKRMAEEKPATTETEPKARPIASAIIAAATPDSPIPLAPGSVDPTKPAHDPPPAPAADAGLKGKLVTTDGITSFVGDDGSELDVTAAIAARDAETRKTTAQKKFDEIQRTMQKAQQEYAAAQTTEEKLAAAQRSLEEMAERARHWANVAQAHEIALRSLSSLVPLPQLVQ